MIVPDPTDRDRRFGGQWRPSQRLKNALIRVVVRAALVVADRLPPGALVRLGRLLGRLAWHVASETQSIAERRVRATLPGHDARTVARASFVNAGESAARCLLLRRPEVRALDIVLVSEASVRVLRDSMVLGKGVIFISAHIGPFEVIPAAIRELGLPATIVVRESYDPDLDPHVDRHRLARGIEVIHRGSPSAPLALLRALRRGRPVGILPDLGARVRSADVPFLGAVAHLPTGAAELARRTGAPVVVGALAPRRGPGPPFSLQIRSVSATSVDDLHGCLAAALGDAVRTAPEHWLWMGAKSLRIAELDRGALDSSADRTAIRMDVPCREGMKQPEATLQRR